MFVNWKYLESQLSKIKTSRFETMNPLDQVDLSRMIDPQKDAAPSAELHQEQGTTSTPVTQEELDAPIVEIEIKNMKGVVKKVDPSDYEVAITANNETVTTRLSQIASGEYLALSEKHGITQAVSRLLHDLEKKPNLLPKRHPILSYDQAKMVLLAVRDDRGKLTKQAIHDVMSKTNNADRDLLLNWINKCHNR